MKNDFVDPKIMHSNHNLAWCWLCGGPKDCNGYLHKISYKLYDENGNELTDENRYTAKIHFKCKCDKCGHEAFLTYDPDEPCILHFNALVEYYLTLMNYPKLDAENNINIEIYYFDH